MVQAAGKILYLFACFDLYTDLDQDEQKRKGDYARMKKSLVPSAVH